MYEDNTSKFVAVDVQELSATARGRKVYNAIQSSNAEEFRSKRGRKIFFVRVDTFEKIKAQMGFEVEEGFDGTYQCVMPTEPHESMVV
jgi:hypothetical protein